MPRQDPLLNYRFRVEIDGIVTGAFSEVTIGETSTSVIEYREGNEPAHARKLPGLTKYGNIVLKRGVMTGALELFNWHRDVASGAIANARKKVVIIVQDESGADKARFVVTDAWPSKYVAGDLNALGNEVFIEALELANEGIERVA